MRLNIEWEQFFIDLEKLGYFRYLTDAQKKQIPRMLGKIKRTGYFFAANVKRDYPADPKRLAKCGVKSFLTDIKRFLKANGVIIDIITENCSRDGYSITVNNTEYLLYTVEELNAPDKLFWTLTTQRAFAIINKLLREAGSDERIFSTFGGSEEWAVFLTLELYDLLVKNGLVQVGKELFLYEAM